jgi:hypothetical protein
LLNAFEIQPNKINDSLSPEDIRRILPALIQVKFNEQCKKIEGRGTWKSNLILKDFCFSRIFDLDILVGFLAVSFINCSAFGGAIILPFRKKSAFKWILTVFIGLGKV